MAVSGFTEEILKMLYIAVQKKLLITSQLR